MDPSYRKKSSSRVLTFTQIFNKLNQTLPLLYPPQPGTQDWTQPSRSDAIRFLTNYYKANRMAGRLKHRAMDMFYIPQRLIWEYKLWAQFFQAHRLIIELALPTLHLGMTSGQSDVEYVKATALWGEDRNMPTNFFDKSTFFLHPFKLAKEISESLKSKKFFCDYYLNGLMSFVQQQAKPKR
jgi:hypothetical protein